MRRIGLGLGLIPTSARTVPTTLPENVVAPAIPAPLTQGQTVAVNPGSWLGLPSGVYSYQKQRWDGDAWIDIGAASSSSSLTFVSADVLAGPLGLRVAVSATNSFGTTVAYSAAVTVAAPLAIGGSPGSGTPSEAYSFTPTRSGGHPPYSAALTGTLPAGLSFNTTTGAITGTPLAAETAADLSITLTDADGLTAVLGPFDLVIAAVGFVTEVEVMSDFDIAITSPSAMTVAMQANGAVLRIKTAGTALYTAVDPSKIRAYVEDEGWATDGTQMTRSRVINMRDHFWKPYNEHTAAYQPVAGEFYLHADDLFFNQDATWKTTIVELEFDAGWVTGATAETFTGGAATRSDSLAYPPAPMRILTEPWQRISNGGNLLVEVGIIHAYGQNNSMIACAEAWLVDSLAATGTVDRTSAFVRSLHTPNDATLKGYPVPTYQLAPSAAGLAGGKVYAKYRVKPWIGPAVESDAYGDDFPTANSPKALPACHDTDASHVPLFAVLSNEQASAPAGKTLIATNTNVATVDITGVSTTLAGAQASNKVYADLGTLATAIRRVNRSASAVTIADPTTGAASYSYQRPTLHDDLSGGVAVCPAVTGSTYGADANAYSMWQSLSSQANYPPGLTSFEIRSQTGLPTEGVRWRGQHSDGSNLTFTSRAVPSRVRLRGLTLDSTGITVANQNVVFTGTESSASAKTESTAICSVMIDCVTKCSTTASAGISVPYYQRGLAWDYRSEDNNATSGTQYNQSVGIYTAGLVVSVGSYYGQDGSSISRTIDAPCLMGVKLRNVILDGPAETGRVRPRYKGRMFFNLEEQLTVTTLSVALSSTVNYPIVGGEGYCNVHVWAPNFTSASPPVGFSNDGVKFEADALIVYHVGAVARQASDTSSLRINIGYQDQGYLRMNKRVFYNFSASRAFNTKTAAFNAPELPYTGTSAVHSTATAYSKGAVVAQYRQWATSQAVTVGQVWYNATNDNTYTCTTAGTTNATGTGPSGTGTGITDGTAVWAYHGSSVAFGYQAKQAVPAGTALTDAAYWYQGGLQDAPFLQQPLRQGNSDFLYMTRCIGNVAAISSNASVPGTGNSWAGIKWDATSEFGATWANYYNNAAGDDYTPKPGGELVNRIPAGRAVAPFDLVGKPIPNDGTGATGPLQIP